MELTRAQETQLRRTGREAMEKVIAAAQQATQNGIQRATAKVTAVNDDCTADVDFGTADYPMPLTGLRYTTGCCSMQVGDRVLVDTVNNQPLITGILANSGNGPYVLLYNRTSQPDTAPVSISGTGNLNEFARLKVYGCTGEWRRSYCEVFKNADGTYHNARFTLSAYNGYSYDAYVKMTDFRVDVANASAWSMVPQSYNEISAHQSSTFTNTFIGSSIVRVVGVREPWLA